VNKTDVEIAKIPAPEIGEALEKGLVCPYCGGNRFTVKETAIVWRPIEGGRWGIPEVGNDGEFLEVECYGCNALVWNETDSEEDDEV
jgi:hypothetical protein